MIQGEAGTLQRCVIPLQMTNQIAQQLRRRVKVLDIGCGDGNIAHHFREQKGIIESVVMIDISYPTVRKAKFWYSINAMCAYAEHLPVKDKLFDVSLLIGVIEHVLDPEPVIAEAERVSQHVIAVVPACEDEDPQHIRIFDLYSLHKLRGGNYYSDSKEQFAGWRAK